MLDSTKRVISKIVFFGGLAWLAYAVIKGIEKDEPVKEIVKEAVKPATEAVTEVKKTVKKFLKGSPEAKAHMASLRAKRKPKKDDRTIEERFEAEGEKNDKAWEKKRNKLAKNEQIIIQRAEGDTQRDDFTKHTFNSIAEAKTWLAAQAVPPEGQGYYKFDVWYKGQKYRYDHSTGAVLEAYIHTEQTNKHKGHKTKKGLALDQKKKSQEKHEKKYRKNKRKKQIKKKSPLVPETKKYNKSDLKSAREFLKNNKHLYKGTNKYLELQAQIASDIHDGMLPDSSDYASHTSADMSVAESIKGERNYELMEEREARQSYKCGGKVKKTGLALVHKGEIIIPKKKAKHGKK